MLGFGRKSEVATQSHQGNVAISSESFEDAIQKAVTNAMKPLIAEIIRMRKEPHQMSPQLTPPPAPVALKVRGLDVEKQSNEILATLFAKMPNPMPQKVRVFYTDLERDLGVALSQRHRERVEGNEGMVGKYPFRKMDSILLTVDSEEVFQYAKEYEFKY